MSATNDSQQRPVPSAFGRLLKRLRTSLDLTQEELAERSGVSARLISDIERGVIQRSRRETVHMLAQALSLDGTDRDTFIAFARRRSTSEPVTDDTGPMGTRANLPTPSGELVGRERELSATTSLVMQPDLRLLTLTGPGGVGKTQLALATANRVRRAFPHDVVFVDLAPLAHAGLVLTTIARAAGVQVNAGQPILDQLVDAMTGLQMLLVLDNVEHVLESAPDIARMLEQCPDLTLLTTSRQALHLRAEREYAVSPLALPEGNDALSLGELSRVPAIELLVRRAEAVRPGFALTEDNARAVTDIAVRLDGLPLAIELAAARIRAVSPAELLERLDRRLPLLTGGPLDLPSRQRTLSAAIEWSHDLLTEDEQRLFRRIAVFAGGFTLAAAEQVCAGTDCGDGDVQVVDTLTSLIDKHLAYPVDHIDHGPEHETTRYAMLETIREYALLKLDEAGEESMVRARHATWCVELAECSEWELVGPDQVRWYARLELEKNNLRAALSWAVSHDEAAIAQRLAGPLWRFWSAATLYAEGRRWAEEALALGAPKPSRPRAKAFNAAGIMSSQQGDHDAAEDYFLRALETYQELDDRIGIAYSYGNLGVISDNREDYAEATMRYERALAEFRELDDQVHAGFMLGNLGLVAYFQGDYDRAESLLTEALENARMRDDKNSQAINLGNMGLVAIASGDADRAEAHFRESFELRKTMPGRGHLARCLDNFALLAATRTDFSRAARLYGFADGLRAEIGAPLPPNDRAFNENVIGEVRSRLGASAFSEAWESGVLMSVDDATVYAIQDTTSRLTRDHAPRQIGTPGD